MILALLSLTIIYSLILIIIQFLFIKEKPKEVQKSPSFISIVISARNEENRINPTLVSLSKLIYPDDKYEVIWVDDASTDKTSALINEYASTRKNWHLISISKKDNLLKGKKTALTKAVDMAIGKIILTTDADCVVPESWLVEINNCFDENTSMVLGHSNLSKRKGWLDKLLGFDNLFSGIMVAAPALLGFPISSVGRNMAYRKKDFIELGGYEKLAQHKSGDDVHLTELFRRNSPGKIRFCFSKKSYTLSKTPDTVKEVIQQQIRKNSKLFKKSLGSIALTLILFTFHLLLVLYPFQFGIKGMWISLLAAKLGIELLTLIVSAVKLSEKRVLLFIPFFQIFYPVYLSLFVFLGVFQRYAWKEK